MEKKFLLLCLFLGVLQFAQLSAQNVASASASASAGSSNTLFFMGENWGVFFESERKKFYAIQYQQKPAIQFSEKIAVKQYAKDGLSIYDASKGTIHHFKLDATQKNEYQVFGIIAFEGESYQKQLLTYEQNEMRLNQVVLAQGSRVLHCNCLPNNVISNCEQGGEGATEFGFSESYNGAGRTLFIGCQRGFFACYVNQR